MEKKSQTAPPPLLSSLHAISAVSALVLTSDPSLIIASIVSCIITTPIQVSAPGSTSTTWPPGPTCSASSPSWGSRSPFSSDTSSPPI